MIHCLICGHQATCGDLCRDCWTGVNSFHRKTNLLAKAITYLGPRKSSLLTKRERKAEARRQAEITRLAQEQNGDKLGLDGLPKMSIPLNYEAQNQRADRQKMITRISNRVARENAKFETKRLKDLEQTIRAVKIIRANQS